MFITYAYRWLAPLDAMTVDNLSGCSDPVRRQLLGFTATLQDTKEIEAATGATGRSGRYYPRDTDAPLRRLIVEKYGSEANQYVLRPVN